MSTITPCEFSAKYPVGTPVRYYPLKGRDHHIETSIRSEAWALGHGDVVVSVDGIAGGVSVDHIAPAKEA